MTATSRVEVKAEADVEMQVDNRIQVGGKRWGCSRAKIETSLYWVGRGR